MELSTAVLPEAAQGRCSVPAALHVTAVAMFHVPVLAESVARLTGGRRRAVDGTVGGGGHTALLLEAGAQVLAVDRDPEAVAVARARFDPAAVTVLHGRFADHGVLAAVRAFSPDLVLLDLGLSSHQIDRDARGFSFRPGVPLDMRMDPGSALTAAELLNRADQPRLERLFRLNADERQARRLARVVARRRSRSAFAVSDDLVNAIREALGPRAGPADFARLFQAVRMEVNSEAGQLVGALPALRDALVGGGILAVISYHSGEDRIVKHAFMDWARSCVCPAEQPVCTCRGHPLGILRPRRPVMASPEEILANPRARSARLRVFLKDHAA